MSEIQENRDSQKNHNTNSFLNIGHTEVSDLAAYEHSAEPWEVMARPLDRKPFSQRRTYLVTPSIILYKESFTSTIQVRGLTPPGMLGFLIPIRMGNNTRFWNTPHGSGMPACMPGGLEAVINSGQVHVIVLLELCLVERMLSEDRVVALKHAASNRLLHSTDQARSDLSRWLENLLYRAQQEPEVFQHPEILHSVEEDILTQLFRAIELPSRNTTWPTLSKSRQGFDRSVEFLRHADLSLLTVPQLCNEAGISQRALEYAFREHFNMTPLSFIRLLRLHSVWRNLLTAQTGDMTITDMAYHYGIYDMGRFASVYKQYFGELPSQTLVKPPVKSSSPLMAFN